MGPTKLGDATSALAHLLAEHCAFLQQNMPEVVAHSDRFLQPSVAVQAPQLAIDMATTPVANPSFAAAANPVAPMVSEPTETTQPLPRKELMSGVNELLEHVRQQLGDDAAEAGLEAIRKASGGDTGAARRLLISALEHG